MATDSCEEAFVQRLTIAAADLALLFVGEPDDRVHEQLQKSRANIERKLVEDIGSERAAQVADVFVAAVLVMNEQHKTIAPPATDYAR